MKKLLGTLVLILIITMTGCKGGSGTQGLPGDFMQMSDSQRLAYMMKEVKPDSLARFVCDAALGKIKGAKIDTLSTANLYVMEHYRDENVEIYIQEFDNYKASKPLVERMKLEKWLGNYDDTALGYQLGLEYVGYIREHNLSVKQIEQEISQLHRQTDPQLYNRFITGFKVALENDRGKDLNEEIYRRFANMSSN